jgi:hypothetical protein
LLQEAESVSSRRGMEKNDSYSLQSGPGWGRELRNRFVFNSKDRNRSSTDYTLRSHYAEQGRSMVTECFILISCDLMVKFDFVVLFYVCKHFMYKV